MSYKDFTSNFTTLDVCMAAPLHDESLQVSKSKVKRHWEVTSYEGSWRRNINAGGCRNHLGIHLSIIWPRKCCFGFKETKWNTWTWQLLFEDTFATNPQYRVEVTDPDEFDDDDTGTIVVALMQKERRKKFVEGQQMLTIGYYVYKVSCSMMKMCRNLIFESEYIIHSEYIIYPEYIVHPEYIIHPSEHPTL